MGKANSKSAINYQSVPSNQQPKPVTQFKKLNILQKNLPSEKKMIIHNWVPKTITKTKISKRFCRLLKRKRQWIKSIKVDSMSLQTQNPEVRKLIPNLKNLKTLDIDFWGNILLKPSNFEFFAKALVSLKHLQNCSLQNHDPDKISLKGSVMFLKQLCYLNKLKKTNFSFTNCLHNNGHEGLIQKAVVLITNLRKINQLQIDFSSCEHFSKAATLELAKRIRKLEELRVLKLDFSCCPNLEQQSFHQLIDKISQLDLYEIKLNFGGVKSLNNETYFKINTGISNLSKLRKLDFSMGGSDIIDQKGMQKLVQSINKLRELVELKLDFSGCKSIIDYHLILFKEEVAFFDRLESLELNFQNCSITDIGIIHLAQAFSSLTNVQKLVLSFGGYENLMDHALTSFSQKIVQFKNLRVLHLAFTKTKITDVGITKFAQDLSSLKELKELSLDFNLNQKISGKGLIQISENVVKLKELRNLMLDFSNCSNLTSDGIMTLTTHLHKYRKVARIYLKFQNCANIDKAAQDSLKLFEN